MLGKLVWNLFHSASDQWKEYKLLMEEDLFT